MLAPDEDRDRRQKISDERDLIWEYAQHSARWREVSRLPEMEHFFVIQPLWFVCWSRKECEVPGPIASVIESDFARKKTSIDIPASPALRFGRCSIDFTVGKYGQIAVQQDSARDNKYGCVAHPPSGTYLLRRSERDESGGYFLTCVSYFHTLFRYLNKQHQLQLLLQGGAARSAQLRAEVLEAKAASKVLFRDMHLRYSRTLLAYKFASSCHERGFYEFLYLATMRILRKVFAAPKMHGMPPPPSVGAAQGESRRLSVHSLLTAHPTRHDTSRPDRRNCEQDVPLRLLPFQLQEATGGLGGPGRVLAPEYAGGGGVGVGNTCDKR